MPNFTDLTATELEALRAGRLVLVEDRNGSVAVIADSAAKAGATVPGAVSAYRLGRQKLNGVESLISRADVDAWSVYDLD